MFKIFDNCKFYANTPIMNFSWICAFDEKLIKIFLILFKLSEIKLISQIRL